MNVKVCTKMFLRLILRNNIHKGNLHKLISSSFQPSSSFTTKSNDADVPTKIVVNLNDVPEIPLQLRLDRQPPGKVRWGFVPEEWFTVFYNKTGVTGFYTLCFTCGIYLVSKEKYVMEHEYYTGVSTFLLCYIGCKSIGSEVAKTLDKYVDEYEELWNLGRNNEINCITAEINDELAAQDGFEGQLILVDGRREMVHLQLEEEYRKRIFNVYKTVIKHLDFTIMYRNRELKYIHKNMTEWVLNNVIKTLTPDFLYNHLNYCIDQLDGLLKHETP